MKIYETMVLVSSELGADKAVDHVRSLIEKHKGEIIRIEKYAEQKLAYEIRKQKRGVYVLTAFRHNPQLISPLEREFSLDEHVLRSLVLDRTGLTVDKFFRRYEAKEEQPVETGAREYARSY
ncbi:MAG: 30S ribosomal protein S6 [Planctomycetaceae bacterium]|nr:30S ribosomal protein S6 [Planctomycetaceae bacterium]